ncbi:hypothetical protein NMY22_g13148 [Coprinellus aureogranulatus]|nr:hypothetical protein NMY22_g13148 [Coprinellus aureogranulatus]
MSSDNSSIDILPPELLQNIFVECVPYPTRDDPGPIVSRNHPAVILSHVCREWRMLSLHSPILWCGMHIRLPTSTETPEIAEWRSAVEGMANAIETWIERSAPCLITVVFYLQISAFNVGDSSAFVFYPGSHDYVCIPRSMFKGSKRWREVTIDIECGGFWGPLSAFLDVCNQYPSATDSFPSLEALSFQVTAKSAIPAGLPSLSSSLMQTGLFSAPSLRRITTKGHCRIDDSASLKEWSRGCSLLTEVSIDLFDPSDALHLLQALPHLIKASFGLQPPRMVGQTVSTTAQVTAPKLVSLSLHGSPIGPEFVKALKSPSLSELTLLFYPYTVRRGFWRIVTRPPEGFADGTFEFLRIFGKQLKGLTINSGPFVGHPLGFCLHYLDNERLETLGLIHTRVPELRGHALFGADSDDPDAVFDRLNHAALKYIADPSVFPNMKSFKMNVYNICSDRACIQALLGIIASRRGRVEEMDGRRETVLGLGDDVLISEGVRTSGSMHGPERNRLQDVHLSFSMPTSFDFVKELTERRVDLGFNLRLDYPSW